MLPEPENRLYYYCKLNTALELILPDRRILLSPMNKTNDPRENKGFTFAAKYLHEKDIENKVKQEQKINEILINDCKLICFSQDYKIFLGYQSSRMWAHYGDRHKGLCLLLDKEEFLNENKKTIKREFLKKINYYELDILKYDPNKEIDYSKMNEIGKKKYLREVFRKENLDYLYYTKDWEWESEKESRLLHFSEKKKNEYCYIRKSLKHLFLGVDFHDSYRPSLNQLYNNTDISKLKYDDGRLIIEPDI